MKIAPLTPVQSLLIHKLAVEKIMIKAIVRMAHVFVTVGIKGLSATQTHVQRVSMDKHAMGGDGATGVYVCALGIGEVLVVR